VRRHWIPPRERAFHPLLVVDDEPPIRRLLRTGLGTQGYDVIDAATGKDALAAMSEKPIW